MESAEPTVELLKDYKEQLMAAATARDKTALLGLLGKLEAYPYIPREVLGRSTLGLAVGRLRDHETEEVSEKAKALVTRWVAAAPPRKKQESPSKSTQISQKESLRRSGSNTTRRSSMKRTSSSRQPSSMAREQTSASARSDAAPTQTMGPPTDPVSRGRKLGRTDTGKKNSASVSAESASNAIPIDDARGEATKSSHDPRKPPRSVQPKTSSSQSKTSSTQPKTSSTQAKTSSAHSTKLPTPPTRTFETDGLGDASALHEVPLRALTVELLYDALAAGAGDMPPRSLLPKAMSIEDALYLDTSPASDDERTDASARTAHTDAYVRCAQSAFIALSSASDFSTMRSDLLKGDISAEDFVDYILGEEDQVV